MALHWPFELYINQQLQSKCTHITVQRTWYDRTLWANKNIALLYTQRYLLVGTRIKSIDGILCWWTKLCKVLSFMKTFQYCPVRQAQDYVIWSKITFIWEVITLRNKGAPLKLENVKQQNKSSLQISLLCLFLWPWDI